MPIRRAKPLLFLPWMADDPKKSLPKRASETENTQKQRVFIQNAYNSIKNTSKVLCFDGEKSVEKRTNI